MTYSYNNNDGIYQTVQAERHPLRWLWWLLLGLILAGLLSLLIGGLVFGNFGGTTVTTETESIPSEEYPHPTPQTVLQCGDHEVLFNLYDDELHSTIDNVSFTLPNVVAADGAKYSDGNMTLWESHGEWMLIRNEGAVDEETIECTLG